MSLPKVHICWFRRDLRLHDQAALYHALQSGTPVVPLFIFDKAILDQLEDKTDRRVEFIHAAITGMQQQLREWGASMEVHYGFPQQVFEQLLTRYNVQAVFTNHDYEPYALKRDAAVAQFSQQ
jgi:deoxyribodipyrimidine photo-lyase